jgi:glycosyltransferase involved in cell wall biosynthesis
VAPVRVVHITSVHPADDVRILTKECRALADAGHEVLLVAPHDRDEVLDGIRIRAVPSAASRPERMTRTVWRCYQAAMATGAAICHVHDPELLGVAILLKLRGRTVVYDAHEDVPRQVLSKPWIPRLARRPVALAVSALEWLASRWVDAVVAATPHIASHFPSGKTVTVQNFARLDELVLPDALPYQQRPRCVVYIGTIAGTRSAREMVQAVGHASADAEATLILAGGFAEPELKQELEALDGWRSAQFRGVQSRHQVAALLGQARVGLVLFYPSPNHIQAYPTKLFEYMAAGVPVVTSDFPLWRSIVDAVHCGLLVDPLDAVAIARSVRWLLDHPREAEEMGERGRRAVAERYCWDLEARKLTALYSRLALR